MGTPIERSSSLSRSNMRSNASSDGLASYSSSERRIVDFGTGRSDDISRKRRLMRRSVRLDWLMPAPTARPVPLRAAAFRAAAFRAAAFRAAAFRAGGGPVPTRRRAPHPCDTARAPPRPVVLSGPVERSFPRERSLRPCSGADVLQVDHEHERAPGQAVTAGLAVREPRRDDQLASASDLHAGDAVLPALDQSTEAGTRWSRRAPRTSRTPRRTRSRRRGSGRSPSRRARPRRPRPPRDR